MTLHFADEPETNPLQDFINRFEAESSLMNDSIDNNKDRNFRVIKESKWQELKLLFSGNKE
jgi:hypothetical protein